MIQTKLFANYGLWIKAGHPVGGIYRVTARSRKLLLEGGGWPERYQATPAWWVILPNGRAWCPWARAFSGEAGYIGEGWDISGEIPHRMTVQPSIAAEGWHGFLTRGILHTPEEVP
jgi:hypothetical protein